MNNSSPAKNRRILVVDDTRSIHDDFRKILIPEDAPAAGLASAEEALFGQPVKAVRQIQYEIDSDYQGQDGVLLVQRARDEGRPYALVFLDVRMPPGWDGVETTQKIWAVDPDIQIVICTAHADYSWEEMFEKIGNCDGLVILKKPFDRVEALQLAHALTEKWWLHQKSRRKMTELERMVAARTRELQVANEQLKSEMAERAQTEAALHQAQKMEALGQLAGGIAHDFNNLLTVIRGYVECLTVLVDPRAEVVEALHEIDGAAERAAKLTSQMLMFSRKKRMQPQSLNLHELITPLATMLRRLLGENISMEIKTGDSPLIIQADPVMIEMVILNLAVNARDAMPQGGQLLIRADEVEIKAADRSRNPKSRPGWFACISVADSGSGIAPEVLPHLFEPFFTTKEVGKGTGLGLASVYGIVKQHAGWIEVQSEPGRGAIFKVFLPVSANQAGPVAALSAKPLAAGGAETILLVEDEPALRRLALRVLQRHGYRVYEADSGVEALSVWAEHGLEINLLLTDMIMPGGVSGRALAGQLQGEKNDLKIIFTSGYSPDAVSQDLVLKEGVNFLAKPYHPDKLIQIMRRALDEGSSPKPAEPGLTT